MRGARVGWCGAASLSCSSAGGGSGSVLVVRAGVIIASTVNDDDTQTRQSNVVTKKTTHAPLGDSASWLQPISSPAAEVVDVGAVSP